MRKIDPETVRRLYHNEKLSTIEIGVRFGYHPITVCIFMRKHGIPKRSRSAAQRLRYSKQPKVEVDVSELVRLYYDERLSLEAVGKRVGCSKQTVRLRLIGAGYVLRTLKETQQQGPSLKVSDAEIAEIVRLYRDERLSLSEVALRFAFSVGTVRRVLKDAGVPIRSKAEAQRIRRERQTTTPTPPSAVVLRLPAAAITTERILQLRRDEDMRIDEIAAMCAKTNLEVYNILQANQIL